MEWFKFLKSPLPPRTPPPPHPPKKKKGGGDIFPKKEGSLVKLVSCSKNRVGYLYFHTNLFQCHLSRRVVCVFYSFTRFLSVFFAFHRKDLVLLNLIGRYLISASDQFLKSKDIIDLGKKKLASLINAM